MEELDEHMNTALGSEQQPDSMESELDVTQVPTETEESMSEGRRDSTQTTSGEPHAQTGGGNLTTGMVTES